MREIINIHIGQAGIQTGAASWELYCLEHNLYADGTPRPKGDFDNSKIGTFFSRTEDNRFLPRSVFLDSQPRLIEELRGGAYRELFRPEMLINANEEPTRVYSRARYGTSQLIKYTCHRIRQMAEECDNLQGFFITHSFGGGSGSGLTASLIRKLSNQYKKKCVLTVPIYPTPRANMLGVVETYNTLLNMTATIDFTTCAFIMDNATIQKICKKKLGVANPGFPSMNQLITQAISGITALFRFPCNINLDLADFCEDLAPLPRVHHPLVSISNIIRPDTVNPEKLSTLEITKAGLDCRNQLVELNPIDGLAVSCQMLYRGDVTPHDVNDAIYAMMRQRRVHFDDWFSSYNNMGIMRQPAVVMPGGRLGQVPRALTTLFNTTAMKQFWKALQIKAEPYFEKRQGFEVFAHEGMEEQEFYNAQNSLDRLLDAYDLAEETLLEGSDFDESFGEFEDFSDDESLGEDGDSRQDGGSEGEEEINE